METTTDRKLIINKLQELAAEAANLKLLTIAAPLWFMSAILSMVKEKEASDALEDICKSNANIVPREKKQPVH